MIILDLALYFAVFRSVTDGVVRSCSPQIWGGGGGGVVLQRADLLKTDECV
jgi:hypothetical protein